MLIAVDDRRRRSPQNDLIFDPPRCTQIDSHVASLNDRLVIVSQQKQIKKRDDQHQAKRLCLPKGETA